MNDEREYGGYKVIHSMLLGDKEIVVAENPDAQFRYICGELESNEIFERITDYVSGNVYVDIINHYLSKCNEQVAWCVKNIPINMPLFKKDECKPIDHSVRITGKVVALSAEHLRREFQNMSSQLYYVNGGFGAEANARGRKIYVTNLYNGEQSYTTRESIMGIVDKDKLPDWAVNKLNEILLKEKDREMEAR